uniref:Pantothenate kinase 1 n=1 Tax=Ananas comosus var. bracteatus TaxID=296719 RepID=A0A6V7P8K8_ANACO|nr:unnamed protein product [Ananas comosus var. bracteatus]
MGTPHVNLDLNGAEIRGELDERNPPIYLPNQPSDSPLLALDIGGTLIKLVYFSNGKEGNAGFETRRLDECLDFIVSKKLLCGMTTGSSKEHVVIKATGGGAFKFADVFKEKLGVSLDKLDEMDSVVAGANFLLQKIPGESFTHMNGKRTLVTISPKNLFPYLLVNIGSGVSIIKVTGTRKFERVSGTHIGGGTMFGLAKLLTGCKSYDEFLKLSQKGDNLVLDLIVKDICGELVCQKQGLSASTLASSFGKAITSKRKLADYKPEDLAATLLSAFTYNIAQISFLVASLLGLRKVFFGGSYIRGHTSTMDNISYAIDFWSKGQMQALFLRHEGFLGSLGALTSYGNIDTDSLTLEDSKEQDIFHDSSAPIDGKLAAEHTESNIFPYLLVNIGSGVSMVEVIGKGKFERIIGTHLGGGTILGLARLLTGCSSYEEFLELSQRGNNLSVDLTVGDIYGEQGYLKHGLPASTTASSFGKVNSNKLSDYKVEDLAAALLSAFSYNIGQIAYFVATLSGMKRIFFRGTYVCGHEKTMDKISRALKYWSKGQVQTTFLCHEGFLGTLGAFWSYESMGIDGLAAPEVIKEVLLGAPYTGGQFPTLPPSQQNDRNDAIDLRTEVEKLKHDNAMLRAMDIFHDSSAPIDGKLAAEHTESNIFPYLLVNIGSGVSMVEVIGKGKFERIIGTHLGGGTILGLARLLTGCSSYEEFLELSQRGNNLSVDLTVGDIYGEQGYLKHGLPASTTASSFGKVNSNKLSDYKVEDLAAALLSAFSYNIGQIAYFVATLSGMKRIFFRGTYVCGHEKTMDKISRALKYWSKGQVQTTFLCHEGFLGTLGAFWSYESMGIDGLAAPEVIKEVLLGAPYTGGQFPTLPPSQQNDRNDAIDLRTEVEKLKHDNAMLRAMVERLQCENEELKAKSRQS